MSQQSKVRKLAKLVLAQTGGGAALVKFLADVADGAYGEDASMRDRIEAAKILLDRGFGRAPVQIDVSGTVSHVHGRVDVSRLSSEELDTIRRTLRRAIVAAELPSPTEVEDAEVVE